MKVIKIKLKNSDVSIGTWMQIPSPDIAEILTHNNFDWIALDLEHGVYNNESILSCVRAIELGNTEPFVRIGEHDEKLIKLCLESGVRGIIIPMVSNAEELKKVISYIHYPSKGSRGVGFSRANLFGQNFTEYFESINEKITIVAQIESKEAVENLDDILKIKDLDAIMVGPYDLSASLGCTGDFQNSLFLETMKLIKEKTLKSNVKMGVHVVKPIEQDLKSAIIEDNKFIAYGIDALFLKYGAQFNVNIS